MNTTRHARKAPLRERGLGLALVASLGIPACGGKDEAKAPVPDAPAATATAPKKKGLPQVQQELGSIDQKAVEKTFAKLKGPLDTCHAQGRDRVEYLSGDVKVFLRIDGGGKVRWSYFEDSSLGDRDTEMCILSVFAGAQWPKPEGGEAEVRHGFGWGPGGERAPTAWGPEKVAKAVASAKDTQKELDRCKAGVSGGFHVTAYVEPNGKTGKFQGIGVVPPNKEGAEKVDCIVHALRGLELPSPGSYAAKVTFSL
jgi:hypothetical protein